MGVPDREPMSHFTPSYTPFRVLATGRLHFVFEKCDRRSEHTYIVASLGLKQITFSRTTCILVAQTLMKRKAVQETSLCRLLNAVVFDPAMA